MKKIAVLSAALLVLLALAGCCESSAPDVPETPTVPEVSESPEPSSTPTPPETSKMDNIPFGEGQLYAVACLGYEGTDALSVYAERYLDSEDLPIHYISSGEYYLIIPRYSDMTLRLYQNSFDAEPVLIYEEAESRPFVIRCNVSDIFPDATIQLSGPSETAEFSPYISLKDGSVEVGDRGLDITVTP